MRLRKFPGTDHQRRLHGTGTGTSPPGTGTFTGCTGTFTGCTGTGRTGTGTGCSGPAFEATPAVPWSAAPGLILEEAHAGTHDRSLNWVAPRQGKIDGNHQRQVKPGMDVKHGRQQNLEHQRRQQRQRNLPTSRG